MIRRTYPRGLLAAALGAVANGPTDDQSARNYDDGPDNDYENDCLQCGKRFVGHKRRCVCRACESLPPDTTKAER